LAILAGGLASFAEQAREMEGGTPFVGVVIGLLSKLYKATAGPWPRAGRHLVRISLPLQARHRHDADLVKATLLPQTSNGVFDF
jgi:hypothetical protein